MEFRVLAPEEIGPMREAVLHSPRILKAEWSASASPALAAGAEDMQAYPGWGAIPPVLADHLQRIERKLDALLERSGGEVPGLNPKPLYDVKLSANGLRFRDHRGECQAGDMLYLCFELPLNPTVEVMALAEVTWLVEDSGLPHLSAGRDIVLEFRAIQDEARELIDRYCRMQEAAAARRRRTF